MNTESNRAFAPCALGLIPVFVVGCAGGEPSAASGAEEPSPAGHAAEAFFQNVAAACGETFRGEGVYPDDPDHDLIDVPLTLVIEECGDDAIRLPLYAGESDHPHATWILRLGRDGELHLYHDHRGEDGEPDEVTGYGGYADERGTALRQYFPADDDTAEMIPEAETNVWILDLDPDYGKFTYYLERHDEPRYRAELEVE